MKRFFIYGLAGWGLEIIWTGLGSLLRGDLMLSGFSYLWMFPIYGLARFLEPLHDRLRPWPWYLRGLIWMSAFLVIEYTTGWLLKSILGSCPWNYSGSRFSVDGLIRLDYAPAWFFAGFLLERLHDTLIEHSIL
jgi:uncharacterized membrane protein